MCAAWTGRGRRQIGRSGRHAARGMFKALPASDLRAGTAALLPVTSVVDLPAQRRTARRSQVSIFVRGRRRRRSTPTLHNVLYSDVGSIDLHCRRPLIPLPLAVEAIVLLHRGRCRSTEPAVWGNDSAYGVLDRSIDQSLLPSQKRERERERKKKHEEL